MQPNNSINVEVSANQPQKSADKPAKSGRRELFSTLAVIIMAPALALLLTAFVFQSYEVDGPSMETTLSDNDRLIVNKTGKTWSRFSGNDFAPERYEIIVFTQSGANSEGSDKKQLIKRVIGLPGDHVVIKDGFVTIFNSHRPDGFLVDREGPEAISASPTTKFTEGNIDQTVKPGEVFVLGDNRANSLDSRVFGPIKSQEVIGNLSVRIYPFDSIKKF